jgi:hypothetical protein
VRHENVLQLGRQFVPNVGSARGSAKVSNAQAFAEFILAWD